MQITFRDIDKEGNGIGQADTGKVYFVPDALPREIAEVADSDSNHSHITERLTESPDRRIPFCPLFESCGSCHLQHLDYEASLRWKHERVADCLERLGGLTKDFVASRQLSKSALPSDRIFNYRNNCRFHVAIDQNQQAIVGFRKNQSHRIVPQTGDECQVISEIAARIRSLFQSYLQEYPIFQDYYLPSELQIRDSQRTHQVLVIFKFSNLSHKARQEVSAFWGNFSDNLEKLVSSEKFILAGFVLRQDNDRTGRVIWRNVLRGRSYFEDIVLAKKMLIGDASFAQVNTMQSEKMAKLLQSKFISGAWSFPHEVWDVYGGTGSLGLHFAGFGANIHVFEINPEAEKYGFLQARENSLENQFIYTLGDATKTLADAKNTLRSPDLVITDPPRQGLSASLIQTIVASNAPYWIYVSCDPATLGRDLKQIAQSYEIVGWQALDMFPWTTHVETVVLMSRKILIPRELGN